jgi:hypothetical protein
MADIEQKLEELFDDEEHQLLDVGVNRGQVRLSFIGEVPEDGTRDRIENMNYDIFGYSTTMESRESTDEMVTVVEFRHKE